MAQKIVVFLAVIAGIAPAAQAQSFVDRLTSQDFEVSGLRFYGVTVFTGYASSAYPLLSGGTSIDTPGIGLLGPDENYGVSASLGWQYHRERTDISVSYSGSYQRMAHYSNLDAFSQSLTAMGSRFLTPKLRFSLSGSASDSTLAQFLFEPSTGLTQAPLNFNDLAATVSIGQYTNSQIASMLTGSPIMGSPASGAIMGNRILSYSGQASMEYEASARLRFHFGSVSAGGQSRTASQPDGAPQTYILPRSFALNAGGGLSYSLSPRTDFGLSVEEDRITNTAQRAYSSTASASIGRKMGMHWFLQAHAGESILSVVQQAYGSPKTNQMVGGGSIGFRTYRHSLVGSYDRASSDTYGFAVGTVATYSGTWLYHAPGSRWTVFTTYAQEQIRNTGFLSLSGWQAGGGLSEKLNDHTVLTTQYVYLSNAGTYQGLPSDFAISSVRLSVSWSPQTAASGRPR